MTLVCHDKSLGVLRTKFQKLQKGNFSQKFSILLEKLAKVSYKKIILELDNTVLALSQSFPYNFK